MVMNNNIIDIDESAVPLMKMLGYELESVKAQTGKPKRDYIGGTPDEVRYKTLLRIPNLMDDIYNISKEFGINPNLFYRRLSKEGFLDTIAKEYNGLSAEEQNGFFNKVYDRDVYGAVDFGMDDFSTVYRSGKLDFKGHDILFDDDYEFDNEKGTTKYGPIFYNVKDALIGHAALLKYYYDQVPSIMKKYGVDEKYRDIYTSAAYNRGLYHPSLKDIDLILNKYGFNNIYDDQGQWRQNPQNLKAQQEKQAYDSSKRHEDYIDSHYGEYGKNLIEKLGGSEPHFIPQPLPLIDSPKRQYGSIVDINDDDLPLYKMLGYELEPVKAQRGKPKRGKHNVLNPVDLTNHEVLNKAMENYIPGGRRILFGQLPDGSGDFGNYEMNYLKPVDISLSEQEKAKAFGDRVASREDYKGLAPILNGIAFSPFLGALSGYATPAINIGKNIVKNAGKAVKWATRPMIGGTGALYGENMMMQALSKLSPLELGLSAWSLAEAGKDAANGDYGMAAADMAMATPIGGAAGAAERAGARGGAQAGKAGKTFAEKWKDLPKLKKREWWGNYFTNMAVTSPLTIWGMNHFNAPDDDATDKEKSFRRTGNAILGSVGSAALSLGLNKATKGYGISMPFVQMIAGDGINILGEKMLNSKVFGPKSWNGKVRRFLEHPYGLKPNSIEKTTEGEAIAKVPLDLRKHWWWPKSTHYNVGDKIPFKNLNAKTAFDKAGQEITMPFSRDLNIPFDKTTIQDRLVDELMKDVKATIKTNYKGANPRMSWFGTGVSAAVPAGILGYLTYPTAKKFVYSLTHKDEIEKKAADQLKKENEMLENVQENAKKLSERKYSVVASHLNSVKKLAEEISLSKGIAPEKGWKKEYVSLMNSLFNNDTNRFKKLDNLAYAKNVFMLNNDGEKQFFKSKSMRDLLLSYNRYMAKDTISPLDTNSYYLNSYGDYNPNALAKYKKFDVEKMAAKIAEENPPEPPKTETSSKDSKKKKDKKDKNKKNKNKK